MGPSPYLLRVLSQPSKVDEQTWQKWYTIDHIPDVVKTGTATRGALFRAYDDFTLQTKTPLDSNQTKLHTARLSHFDEHPSEKTFCAVYQSDHENPYESEELKRVRQTSDLIPGGEFMPCATWDIRVYKLIQNYDPDNLGEAEAPYVLHVQNEPADDADYHDFYENEHLGMLHKVPGYRRSQRYQLTNIVPGGPSNAPRFMAIHEFDHLDALDGPELREADASPNTHRVFGNAKAVNIRGFKCVSSTGYVDSKQ